MSEQSNEKSRSVLRPTPSESLARRDFAGVECSGLTRAFDLLASGQLDGESALALLRHELATVQRQAEDTCAELQKSSVELRQLRESAQREQVQKQDEQRQLQDQNDRFVANLICEHDLEKATLRRERDAAIDRVRELSRGIARAGSSSSASIQRHSLDPAIRSAPPPQGVVELKARIDELLYERDRSLRLLRQLAEQRDLAESRLQSTLASLGASGANGSDLDRGVTPTNVERTAPSPDRPQAAPEQLRVAQGSGALAPTPPGAIPMPTLPATLQPQSNSIALATLEDPDNWEVGPPALAGNEALNPSTEQATRDVPTPSSSSARAPTVPRFTKDGPERSGAYSMVASELADDELHVTRPKRTTPKTS